MKRNVLTRLTLLMTVLALVLGTFSIAAIAASQDKVDAKAKVISAFMDSTDTLYVTLGLWARISDNSGADFTLKQKGGATVGIKSVVSGEDNQNSPDVLDVGFEVIDDGKKVRFAISPGCMELPLEADNSLDMYIVGDMNNWGGLKNGAFVADASWKMTWNKSADSYELIKEIGNGQGQVSLGQKFRFVQKMDNANVFYPQYALKIFDYNISAKFVKITLNKKVDPTKEYVLFHPDFENIDVCKRGVLTLPQFTYKGNDLGAVYTKTKTNFRVWAPSASFVNLVLYPSQDAEKGKEIPMKKDVNGTWKAQIKGDLKNTYYNYKVGVNGVVNEAVDPYVKAVAKNGYRGMIVDLSETNPKGWAKTKKPSFKNPEDAIFYELDVRDFTINKNSGVSEKNRGKFLGFTETGTKGPDGVKTGIDHLKELGITHVHLMPIFDFAGVDEVSNDPKNYNWGYNPQNYNVPEGWFSTNPSVGTTRIKEFKQMVKALHENGIRVVMDVVYNHTGTNNFDLIVPQYYYRVDKKGLSPNGSGCNNDTASEHPMMRKFIVDSVKYWAKEYGIDGFRFDLMALHDKDTMKQVEQELHKIDQTIFIYGEPWSCNTEALDQKRMMVKGNQKNMHIAVFNDNIRNAIKGDTRGTLQGFATGATDQLERVKLGVAGSIDDITADPEESINYVSAHDDLCLWDKIASSNSTDSIADRKKMQNLTNAIVLTSQGVPFIHGGEDIVRTKGGSENSYDGGDAINQFDWEQKAKHKDVFDYYKGMITLRKAHPAFRMTTAQAIRKNLQFIDSPSNTIAFTLNNNANSDSWKTILVIYNPNKEAIEVNLPQDGAWTVVADDDEAGITPVKTGTASFKGRAIVPPITAMVLYKN